MRLVFRPDDLDEYAAARERLRAMIVSWSRRRGMPAEPALVAAALDRKHAVDGRLGHWTCAHVTAALTEWFPRSVPLREDERADVPVALHAVIGFLAEHDWLDARSDPPDQLHAQIVSSTPAMHAALADERNHDLGTFWAVQMLRHGVDTSDPVSVNRFLTQVEAGEIPIDRAALAEVMARESARLEKAPPPSFPPVLLPGAAEILTMADRSPALARLRGFTRWVRAGRSLTRQGRLMLGDAREVAELLDIDQLSRDRARSTADLPETMAVLHWARHARLVHVRGGRLLPVKSAAPLLSRPIELWCRAFEALGRLGEHPGSSDVLGAPSLFGLSLTEALQILWRLLYSAGGDPVPIERFHREARRAVDERFGCVVDDLASDSEQRLWRRDVTTLLDTLELLGAVRLDEVHDPEELAELAELARRDDPDPTVVALTPIGLWAVHRLFVAQGIAAPLVEDLAEEDIEYVCVQVAPLRQEVADAALTAWLDARQPRAAVEELTRFLARTDEPRHRALAEQTLTRAQQRMQMASDTGRPHAVAAPLPGPEPSAARVAEPHPI